MANFNFIYHQIQTTFEKIWYMVRLKAFCMKLSNDFDSWFYSFDLHPNDSDSWYTTHKSLVLLHSFCMVLFSMEGQVFFNSEKVLILQNIKCLLQKSIYLMLVAT